LASPALIALSIINHNPIAVIGFNLDMEVANIQTAQTAASVASSSC
jgi:hypothetical protein